MLTPHTDLQLRAVLTARVIARDAVAELAVQHRAAHDGRTWESDAEHAARVAALATPSAAVLRELAAELERLAAVVAADEVAAERLARSVRADDREATRRSLEEHGPGILLLSAPATVRGARPDRVAVDETRRWPVPDVDRAGFLAPVLGEGRLGSWPVADAVRRDAAGDRRSRALTRGRGGLDG